MNPLHLCGFGYICKAAAFGPAENFRFCHQPETYLGVSLMESLSAARRREFEVFAISIADNARALSLPRFRRPVDVTLKGDMSPVTAVDRGVESMLRERIEHAWPSHGLL